MAVSKQINRSLRAIPLLESLGDSDLRAIESRCRWRTYERDAMILDKGSTSRDVFFVLKGLVAVVTFSPTGKDVMLATMHPGEFFGEMAALDEQPRSASVMALVPSEICIMPADIFLDLVRGNATIAFRLMLRLVSMVRHGDLRILEISTLPAAQRVYSQLLRMARPETAVPGQWVVSPLPPMQDIAGLTSTSRETVNRAMSQLYPSGLLKKKGRHLYITDRAKLQELVQTIEAHTGRQSTV